MVCRCTSAMHNRSCAQHTIEHFCIHCPISAPPWPLPLQHPASLTVHTHILHATVIGSSCCASTDRRRCTPSTLNTSTSPFHTPLVSHTYGSQLLHLKPCTPHSPLHIPDHTSCLIACLRTLATLSTYAMLTQTKSTHPWWSVAAPGAIGRLRWNGHAVNGLRPPHTRSLHTSTHPCMQE